MVGETQTTSSRLGKLPVASRDEFKQDAKRNFSEEIKGAFSFPPQTDKDCVLGQTMVKFRQRDYQNHPQCLVKHTQGAEMRPSW